MAVVVAEHQRAHAEALGGLGGHGQGHERTPLVAQMVGHVQAGVAELLHPA